MLRIPKSQPHSDRTVLNTSRIEAQARISHKDEDEPTLPIENGPILVAQRVPHVVPPVLVGVPVREGVVGVALGHAPVAVVAVVVGAGVESLALAQGAVILGLAPPTLDLGLQWKII